MSRNGVGDDLMAAGEAEAIHRETGKRVRILDEHGTLRWHSLWEMNPAIVAPTDNKLYPYADLRNHVGHRGNVLEHHPEKWVWNPLYRAQPATVYLTAREKDFADAHAGHVVIEPNVRAKMPNKQWGIERWRHLVQLMHGAGIHPVQLGPRSTPILTGCKHIVTETIREAAAVLSAARAAVLPEGGLHHLAAAMRLPAVVIFGAFVSPQITGYRLHTNIWRGQGAGCGRRQPCECCARAMASISPEYVFDELNFLLSPRRAA